LPLLLAAGKVHSMHQQDGVPPIPEEHNDQPESEELLIQRQARRLLGRLMLLAVLGLLAGLMMCVSGHFLWFFGVPWWGCLAIFTGSGALMLIVLNRLGAVRRALRALRPDDRKQ
jgi:hypothetical protein